MELNTHAYIYHCQQDVVQHEQENCISIFEKEGPTDRRGHRSNKAYITQV